MRATGISSGPCPSCSYRNPSDAATCGLCGALLRRSDSPCRAADPGPRQRAEVPPQPTSARATDRVAPAPRIAGLPEPWFFFWLGAPLALSFASGPFMQRYAWYLAALFHETGHAAAGLVCGCPAIPAISLTGHAATVHGEQVVPLALAIWAGLAALTWQARDEPVRRALLGVATLAYPAIAFTGARELLHLVAGHLAELAIAWLGLFRAFAGEEFRYGGLERGAWSAVGWLLLGSNVGLCFGLATSAIARDAYLHNGSFGLQNDYVRIADDVLGWGLPAVAAVMLAVSVAPAPLALAAGWLVRRARG